MLCTLTWDIGCVNAQSPPVINYNTPQVFTAGSIITPLSPANTGGATYPAIYGQPLLFTASEAPFSLATDKANNIYTTNNNTGDLIKYDQSGKMIFTVSTGVSQSSGLSIDGFGNIYVSQFTLNQVLKYDATGKLIAVINGFDDPYGIAFDASNNAYVANYKSGDILKIAANDTVATTYLTGFTNPYGIAIDASGNIYVGEQSLGDIIKIAHGTLAKSILASGFNGPRHLNIDGYGNIYVADFGNNAIKRISPAGKVSNILAAGLSSPRQSAFDTAGNLYIADFDTNSLKKSLANTYTISDSLPAGLSFNSSNGQITGTPATITPLKNYTITASNTGGTSSTTLAISVNAKNSLSLPILTILPTASIAMYGATVNALVKASGDSTSVSVTYSGVPDFAWGITVPLGTSAITQTGKNVAYSITALASSTTYYYRLTATNAAGTTVSPTLSFTTLQNNDAALSSLAISAGIFTPYFSPGNLVYRDTVNSTTGVVQITPVKNDANATVTINGLPVNNTATAVNLITGNNVINILVTAQDGITTRNYTVNLYKPKASQTITTLPLAVKKYGDADFDMGASATGGGVITYTSSNNAVATIINGKVHITGAGAVTIIASQHGDINYNAATPVSQTFTISKASLTITAGDASLVYGQPLPALSVTYAGFVNNDAASNLSSQPTISTTAVIGSPVGNYITNAKGAVSSNYIFIYKPGSLNILAGTNNITFSAIPAKTYGDANFSLTGTSSSGLPVIYTSSDNSIAAISGNTVHIIMAGTVVITASQPADANYNAATSVSQTLIINKAPLTIIANDISIAYNNPIPTFTPYYNGFVNGDQPNKLKIKPAVITPATIGSAAGNYPIVVSGAISDNYTFTYIPAVLTIVQAKSTVTFNAPEPKTYGDADFPLISTSTSGLPVSFTSSDNSIATITGNIVHILKAGVVAVTAIAIQNNNYSASEYITQTLIINKAPLTIKANNKNINYGDAIPALDVIYDGFVYNDNVSSLTTLPVINTVAVKGSPASAYAITPAGDVSSNYDIDYKSGILNITPNNSAIIFTGLPTKTYGDDDFSLNASSSSNLIIKYSSSDNTIATISGSTVHILKTGSVSITASQPGNINYAAANNISQTLTINKAPLTIIPDNVNLTYGQAIPALTVTYNGFVYNDKETDLSSLPNTTTTATVNSSAGNYIIKAANAISGNYNITYQPGILTIGQAGSFIDFGPITAKTYGDGDFLLAATSSSGLPLTYRSSNSDIALISGNNVHILKAGAVLITASQEGNVNYMPAEHVNQALNINKALLTVTANDVTKNYGEPNPALTVTYKGFLKNDNSSGLSLLPVLGTAAGQFSPAGIYPVTVYGGTNDNYTVTYLPGKLTINETLTALNPPLVTTQKITFPAIGPKKYGDVDFSPNATTSNNGNIILTSDNSAVAVIINGYIHITGAGTANITATLPDGSSGKVSQSVVVNKAAITITTDRQSKTYGTPDQVFSYQITSGSLYNGDILKGALTRDAGEQAGTYIINQGTLVANNNYTINYIGARLTIIPAQLTVTANNKWITKGDAIPELTVAYSGFVNGDDFSKLITAPTVVTTATSDSPVGTYLLTPANGTSSNYFFTYETGTLTIGKNTSSVTAAQSGDNQIIVHQAVSPNGDGINDFLMIQGIENYPENKVTIINRNGLKVYEMENYNNSSRVFDGHSNVNGTFQQPGTYYYKIECTVNNESKSQTGFIILKY